MLEFSKGVVMDKLNMTELMSLTTDLEKLTWLVILLDLNSKNKIPEFLDLIGKKQLLNNIKNNLSNEK